MRLVYATDLHSDAGAYEQFANLAQSARADVVVLGGDWFAYSRTAAPQIAFAAGAFRHFLERLQQLAIPILAIHGNVDRPASIVYVRQFERENLLHLLGIQPYTFSNGHAEAINFIGYPLVPPTPFRLKDHERRDLRTDRYCGPWPVLLSSPDPTGEPIEAPGDYFDRLPSIEADLAAIPPTKHPCILVAHSPPWGVCDLDSNGRHAGSHAIRRWIEAHQPRLALYGHIHEAPDRAQQWVERIGSTLCINPGASTTAQLQAVVADTNDLPASLRHTSRGRYGL